MKYTINDIAKMCEVGKSTVSRVINNDPRVKQSTRERIQQVIDSLGFQPNHSARAMRGAADPVVGIIVTRLNSSAESQTLSAILPELYRRNITPLIVESQFQVEQIRRHFQLFKQRQVSGIILFGFSGLPIELLHEWKGSLVSVARQYPQVSSVFYDDSNAVNLLMNQLYRQGHRHIAYLGVFDRDETTGRQRTESYLAFCAEQNLEPNFIQTDLDIESGYHAVPQLFARPVEALLCASGSLAVGAFKYLQEKGENRPLAFIGQNDLLRYVAPTLISLDFGYPQAGKWAVELLLKQLNGNKLPEQRQVPFKLSK